MAHIRKHYIYIYEFIHIFRIEKERKNTKCYSPPFDCFEIDLMRVCVFTGTQKIRE